MESIRNPQMRNRSKTPAISIAKQKAVHRWNTHRYTSVWILLTLATMLLIAIAEAVVR